MAARLVTLEKPLRVRPVIIREVRRRLIAKRVIQSGGEKDKETCGSVNFCAGLESGIEGEVHVVREQEDLVWGDMGNKIRERLETEDQAQIIVEIVRKRDIRERKMKLETTTEEREGYEEAEES